MLFLADSAESAVVQLLHHKDLIPLLAVGGGLIVGALAIVFGSVRAMVIGRAREETRREIAAYVAQGTIDPDKAIAMIEAGKDRPGCA